MTNNVRTRHSAWAHCPGPRQLHLPLGLMCNDCVNQGRGRCGFYNGKTLCLSSSLRSCCLRKSYLRDLGAAPWPRDREHSVALVSEHLVLGVTAGKGCGLEFSRGLWGIPAPEGFPPPTA